MKGEKISHNIQYHMIGADVRVSLIHSYQFASAFILAHQRARYRALRFIWQSTRKRNGSWCGLRLTATIIHMYADRKSACSKLQDIKIEGERGPTGNERGDGLIGIIRPERNDDVIVTDGSSNRALSMRASK